MITLLLDITCFKNIESRRLSSLDTLYLKQQAWMQTPAPSCSFNLIYFSLQFFHNLISYMVTFLFVHSVSLHWIWQCRVTFRKMHIKWIRRSNILVERNSVVFQFSGDINVPYKCNIILSIPSLFFSFFNDTLSKMSCILLFLGTMQRRLKRLPINVNCWN